jgi:hypothetical protein
LYDELEPGDCVIEGGPGEAGWRCRVEMRKGVPGGYEVVGKLYIEPWDVWQEIMSTPYKPGSTDLVGGFRPIGTEE